MAKLPVRIHLQPEFGYPLQVFRLPRSSGMNPVAIKIERASALDGCISGAAIRRRRFWIGETRIPCLLAFVVQLTKCFEAEEHFTANFDRSSFVEPQRHRPDGADIAGTTSPVWSVPPRHSLIQKPAVEIKGDTRPSIFVPAIIDRIVWRSRTTRRAEIRKPLLADAFSRIIMRERVGGKFFCRSQPPTRCVGESGVTSSTLASSCCSSRIIWLMKSEMKGSMRCRAVLASAYLLTEVLDMINDRFFHTAEESRRIQRIKRIRFV